MTVYDVAIVGAGLSAGPTLEVLAQVKPRLRILLIDRGPQPWPSIPWRKAGVTHDQPRWWTRPEQRGAANLWYGQLSDFSGEDFETPHPWPINSDDLRPFSQKIQAILRPFCADHLLHRRKATHRIDRTLRSNLASFETAAFETLSGLGFSPYSGLTCLGGHGWSAAPVNPVTLKPLSLIRPQAHDRNWTHRIAALCNAHENICFLSGLAVTSIADDSIECRNRNCEVLKFKATKIFLAAGVTETFRLLVDVSTASRLGAGFTLTTELTAYVHVPHLTRTAQDEITGRFANLSYRLEGGKVSIYDAAAFEGTIRFREKMRTLANAFSGDLSTGTTLKFSFKGQSEVTDEKRVEIGPNGQPQIVYTPSAADFRLISTVEHHIRELVNTWDGAYLIAITDNVRAADNSSAHLHGGAAMGTSSSDVLTPACTVRGAEHIAVLDATSMPGSGSTNSSLTIMANALRVASSAVQDI
jgi:choline dehydrogenase-like flavoprotein